MVHVRRGTAAIVALGMGAVALATAPVTAEAAMFRLPVGTQRMQMPLDCEATSLTIALASVGVHTTQQYVQGHFPTDTRAPVLGANGLPAQWGDPYTGLRRPRDGLGAGQQSALDRVRGMGRLRAGGRSGGGSRSACPWRRSSPAGIPQALYAAVEAGHPVLVWTTVNYSSQTARTWTAWDGRTVPWTEAGHVVVLMGVNTTAGTLEFSDPLTGSYNGTTMAQFARTFTIYGSMAIVIERTARAARPTPPCGTWRPADHARRRRQGRRRPHARAVGSDPPRAHPERVRRRRQRRCRRREPRTADRRHRGSTQRPGAGQSTACRGDPRSSPLVGVLLAVLMRRRRRQCAG